MKKKKVRSKDEKGGYITKGVTNSSRIFSSFCLGIQRMGGCEREGRKKSKTTRLTERVMECCTTEAMNELKKDVGSKL